MSLHLLRILKACFEDPLVAVRAGRSLLSKYVVFGCLSDL